MSITIWLTGRPASGKTTTAHALRATLLSRGMSVLAVDGDDLRKGLSGDLGFSAEDRSKNVQRAAHIARLANEQDMVCIVALISPIAADREKARDIVGPERFLEVYLQADLAKCESRDPKGNYQLARQGVLKHFTGISDLYEAPSCPGLVLDTTGDSTLDLNVQNILTHLGKVGVIRL